MKNEKLLLISARGRNLLFYLKRIDYKFGFIGEVLSLPPGGSLFFKHPDKPEFEIFVQYKIPFEFLKGDH